jgi:hypothetical protein
MRLKEICRISNCINFRDVIEMAVSHHLMHALHKQASMSAAEFQRWGQRVVYHSAGAATHDLGQSHASTMMMADKASDLIRGRTAPEAVVVGSIAG